MNIRSKWLRFIIAGLMLGAVSLSAGCGAASDSDGETLEDLATGSDDIGAGGVDAP